MRRDCLLLWTVLLLLPLGLTLPGCSTTGGMGSNNSAGPLDTLALRELGYNLRWSASLAPKRNGGISAATTLGDAIAVVEKDDSIVTLLNAQTGETRWKRVYALPHESLFQPHRYNNQLVLHTEKRAMLVNMINGDEATRFNLEEHTVTDAVMAGSLLILGGVNGKLYALDLAVGYPSWAYALTGRFIAPPVVSNTDVFAVDANGVYAMLTASDGTLRWRNRVFGPVTATPAMHRGDVLVPSHDRSLYALERATGTDEWVFRAEQPLTLSPISLGADAYLPLPGKGLTALDDAGRAKWTIEQQVVPLARTGKGILGALGSSLVLLDPADGSILQRVDAGDLDLISPGPDESLLIVTRSGRVLRLDPIR